MYFICSTTDRLFMLSTLPPYSSSWGPGSDMAELVSHHYPLSWWVKSSSAWRSPSSSPRLHITRLSSSLHKAASLPPPLLHFVTLSVLPWLNSSTLFGVPQPPKFPTWSSTFPFSAPPQSSPFSPCHPHLLPLHPRPPPKPLCMENSPSRNHFNALSATRSTGSSPSCSGLILDCLIPCLHSSLKS